MSRLRTAFALAACAAVLTLGACGSDDRPERGAAAPADATRTPTPDRPALAY